ncbi:ribonuclease inhibitor-like [Hemitrygon akajei]|uniref:ribonuclease inhibitor-like n=1 Tax=Hemitrygon akajei TaxID=2704970 RepID=UPI003BF9477E
MAEELCKQCSIYGKIKCSLLGVYRSLPAGGAFFHPDGKQEDDTQPKSEWTQSVTELAEKGNRAAASKLLLDLVMEKGTGAQRVILGRNELGDSGMKPVSAALNNLECKIEKLRLSQVGVTDSGAKELTSALNTNRSLTELLLSENDLGDSGVKLVSAALRNPECKIRRLGLERVVLTDSGAEDLASALRTNPSLMELYLGDNKLGDTGVKLMSVGLRNPECKIQKLRLERIGLTESGAEDLASALNTNPSLTELQLSDNELGDSGVKLVSTALRNPECWTMSVSQILVSRISAALSEQIYH